MPSRVFLMAMVTMALVPAILSISQTTSQTNPPQVHQYTNPGTSDDTQDETRQVRQEMHQSQNQVQQNHQTMQQPLQAMPLQPPPLQQAIPQVLDIASRMSQISKSQSVVPSVFSHRSNVIYPTAVQQHHNSINSLNSKIVPTVPMITPLINPYLAGLLSSYSMSSPSVVESMAAPAAYYNNLVKSPSYVRIPYFTPTLIPGSQIGSGGEKKTSFLRRILFNSDPVPSTTYDDDEEPKSRPQRRRGNFLSRPLRWFFVRKDSDTEDDEAQESSMSEDESDLGGNSLNFKNLHSHNYKNGNHHPLGPEFDSLGPGTFLNYNGELMFIPVDSMQTFRSLNQISGRDLNQMMPRYHQYPSPSSSHGGDFMATSESLLSTLWKLIKK